MLSGCVPWPPDFAARYRAQGYWEDTTLWGLLQRAIARSPHQIALVHGDQRISYRELGETSLRLAAHFHTLGVRPSDRIVMQLHNVPAFAYVYFALQRLGAIPVMALRAHRRTEILHFVRSSGAIGYVIPDRLGSFDYRTLAVDVARECPALRFVLVDGEPLSGQHALPELLVRPVDIAPVDALRVDPDEVATMLLSGGTTSLSKLIPRTHNDYVLNAKLCSAAAGFDEQTVLMAILPLAHNYNLASPGMIGAFCRGGTVVLAPSTDTEAIFALVEKERVTVIAAVVPLIVNWLASDVAGRYDTSSLRVVQNGGARLQPELRSRLLERFGCIPQEIYGTAEGLINMTRLDDPPALLLESSGAPVCDDDEIAVVDDDGNDVGEDAPGELITRGPYTIRGYYNAPEKNAEAFTADGFYRMGDVVRRRGRHVFAEGRKKDFINRGGEKISCEEVEGFIVAHPSVKAVALVAMPDPVFGEKACAFVILHEGASLSFDELIRFLKSRDIATFKLPERLECVEAFPLSPVGKVLKRQMREALAERLGSERGSNPP